MDNNVESPVVPGEETQEIKASETPETEAQPTEAPADNAAATNDAKPEKKKSKTPLILLIVVLLLIGGGVAAWFLLNNQSGEKKNDNQATEENEQAKAIRMTGNSLSNFDLAFLKKNNTANNSIYSPLSIKYALRMLSDGAKGDTKSEIDAILGDYTTTSYINNANRSLANALFVATGYKSNILDNYINGLKNNYGASVIFDDFTSASNLNKWVNSKTLGLIKDMFKDEDVADVDFALVNALAIDMTWNNRIQCAYGASENDKIGSKSYWTEYKHEKVKEGISCVDVRSGSDTFETIDFDGSKKAKVAKIGASINRYDIVNKLGEDKIRTTVKPLYEKWLAEEAPRNSDGTIDTEYTEPDADKYLTGYIAELKQNYGKVYDSTDFKMYADNDVKVFAKDLKTYEGVTLQYVGIMPTEQKLADYIKSTDANKLSETIGKLKDIKAENFKDGVVTLITGSIPFFKYDYSLDLMGDLESLGIKKAFAQGEADLSGMTTAKNAYIGDARHKAEIEFTNDGIRAAAVTYMGGMGNMTFFDYEFDVPVETIDLTFNKPYMYLIRDKKTGEVWFAGTVYTPSTSIAVK